MKIISVCIITKNEQDKLKKCLKKLSGYNFEIVVVDTGSTDNTIEIAKEYAHKVCHFTWCDDFSSARNYAISQATSDYILVLDSDEYMDAISIEHLYNQIKSHPTEVGRILRRNVYEQAGETVENIERINRLFPKKYYEYTGKIHEQIVRIDRSPYTTYECEVAVLHDGYAGTKEERQKKAKRNLALLLQENQDDPYILYQIGKSYYMMEEYKEAAEYLGKTLYYDLDPQLEYVISTVESYAYALLNSGQASVALGLEGVINEFGKYSDFCFVMALIYMNNEMFDKAIAMFEKAIRCKNSKMVGTDSYLAYYNIGVICECLKDYQRAKENYEKCGEYKKAKIQLSHLPRIEEHPIISIIILSYNNLKYTKACIESIRTNSKDVNYEIVIVDNASNEETVEWLKKQKDIKLLCNETNVGFPKGCNQGIAMADSQADILLLNNDTLVPKYALYYLQLGLYSNANIGAVGCVTNSAPNYQQIDEVGVTDQNYEEIAQIYNIPQMQPYENKLWLVGFAVLFKRTVLNEVGLLDEQFSPGNYEDTDIGFRIAAAGYRQLLCHNSFIFHYGSVSFGEKQKKFLNLLEINKNKFMDKWGVHPYKYTYRKTNVLSYFPENKKEELVVLDVGAGGGSTLSTIAYRYPYSKVNGIEKNEQIAALAQSVGNIEIADIEKYDITTCRNKYDVIITSGIWEEVQDPNKVMKTLISMLKKGGVIVGAIYNEENIRVMNHTTGFHEEIGMFAKEHQRLYSIDSWIKLCNEEQLEILDLSYELMDNISAEEKKQITNLCQTRNIQDKKMFEINQYTFVLAPRNV